VKSPWLGRGAVTNGSYFPDRASLFWMTIPMGVPVVWPSRVPDLMRTSSGSPREVVIIDWPGFRRSSSR